MLLHPKQLLLSLLAMSVLSGVVAQTPPAQPPAAAAQAPAAPPTPPPTPYDTALFQIIRSGDAAALQKKLGNGADPNAIADGQSALMAATLFGGPDEMRLLLDKGAKPNYADPDSLTALWLAVPDSAKTALLLDHGADPNMLSSEHYSALVKLVNFPGTVPLFQLLVARGANPKKAAPDNMLLYGAASTGDTALLGLLLRMGFRSNDTVSFGDYPLNAALSFRTFATVKMLIDSGANMKITLPRTVFPNMRGMTPLMLAAGDDDEKSFFYLLEHGADPNAKSVSGYTALMFLQLTETDHPAMTRALLDHGADPKQKDTNGDRPYDMALKKGNVGSAQLLKQ
jgi:ankyrin repeat protein